eukprot:scaffold12956_cov71-Cyclotella_meneghiniana.AAC.4
MAKTGQNPKPHKYNKAHNPIRDPRLIHRNNNQSPNHEAIIPFSRSRPRCSGMLFACVHRGRVRGDDLSKYTLLAPAGGCKDSQDNYYPNIYRDFSYKDYTPSTYSAVVEKCAGWCLQNGPPQYKFLGFQTYTKAYAEDNVSDPYIQCQCQFDGNLPSPLPTYNPASEGSDTQTGTGPMQASDDKDYVCYALNPPTGPNLSKYTLVSPAGGGCEDSQGEYYSQIERNFEYKDYPQLSYSDLVEKCAGWCLQNGPPQYKLLGFETYTKAYAEDDAAPYIQCECEFEGNLPNPLPTYIPASLNS